jgi:site-specific DNA-methyltransferase (adenine-specific)
VEVWRLTDWKNFHGNIAVCDDCMNLMKTLPDKAFELAICDPPYRDENQPTKDMRKNGSMKSLRGRPSREYFIELQRVSSNQIIWGANNFQLPQFKGFIIWEKDIPEDFTMSMAEMAAISEGLGTISKIFKLRASGQESRIHPTQKPVKLYEWILTHYAKPGDHILDTHLGSGSSRIAAYNLGFDFVGCEIDEDYFKAQEERYQAHTAQTSLFVEATL